MNASKISKSFHGAEINVLSNLKNELPFNLTMTTPTSTGEKESTIFMVGNEPAMVQALSAWLKLFVLESYAIIKPGLHARKPEGAYEQNVGCAHSTRYQGGEVSFTASQVEKSTWFSVSYLDGTYIPTAIAVQKQRAVHIFVDMFITNKSLIIRDDLQNGRSIPVYLKRLMKKMLECLNGETVEDRRAIANANIKAARERNNLRSQVAREVRQNTDEGITAPTGKTITLYDADGVKVKVNPGKADPCLLTINNEFGKKLVTIPLPTTDQYKVLTLNKASEQKLPVVISEKIDV